MFFKKCRGFFAEFFLFILRTQIFTYNLVDSPPDYTGHHLLPLAGDPRRVGDQAGPGADDAGPRGRPLPQEQLRYLDTLFSSTSVREQFYFITMIYYSMEAGINCACRIPPSHLYL